jgi:hypothetical protein
MKKGPLEFKRPKFWEERDGLIRPSHRFICEAGSEIQGQSMDASPTNSHREIGDLACV